MKCMMALMLLVLSIVLMEDVVLGHQQMVPSEWKKVDEVVLVLCDECYDVEMVGLMMQLMVKRLMY